MRPAACVILAAAVALTAAERPAIRLEADGTFRVTGWRTPLSKASEAFAVHVDSVQGGPPVAGAYRLDGGELVFRPRYPLQAGVRYRATLHAVSPPVTAIFELPKPAAAPATRLTRIYPSADQLPENQLKLYLHFSAAMSMGEAWRRIRLLDDRGQPVSLPFLEIEQELWDRGRRRLTALFDPGRIKRGLVPSEDVGPPIVAGHQYTLVVDAGWPDAAGRPLRESFEKKFRVGPADRTSPAVDLWRITPPGGSTDALVVDFPEAMDRALLDHLLEVRDSGGAAMAGEVLIDREETRWSFRPRQAWKPGTYALVVETAIEDLAGNRTDRLFDVDRFERIETRPGAETRSIPFVVGSR